MKHTMGPWTHKKYDGGDFGVYQDLSSSNGRDIALVRYGFTDETVEANARLIAAAPELLKALERYVIFDEDDQSDLRADAIAIIEQAKGE